MCGPDRNRLLVALNATREVGRETLCRLSRCGPWLARRGRGTPPPGTRAGAETLDRIRSSLLSCDRIAEDEERRARAADASILTMHEPDYPAALLDLPLPPPVLYIRGEIPNAPAVAVVGSRRADSYGLETTRLFTRYLAARGAVVVSGLALGIDSAAHRGALEADGGRTVAVLGCGIDVEYPRGTARLASRISERGAVVSELPMGTRPLPHHFPMRNRIIAALGVGAWVVRATARSGSLITARLAVELGRDVYALPANIFDPRSTGPNSLIRDGALPVQHPREILESLPLALQDRLEALDPAEPSSPVPTEPHLTDLLGRLPFGEEKTPEALAKESGMTVAAVLATLLELELGGWVVRAPGPSFHRRG